MDNLGSDGEVIISSIPNAQAVSSFEPEETGGWVSSASGKCLEGNVFCEFFWQSSHELVQISLSELQLERFGRQLSGEEIAF